MNPRVAFLLIVAIPAIVPAQAIRYSCPAGETLHVIYQPEISAPGDAPAARALVQLEGSPRLALPRVESASGARFSDGYTTLWTKGTEAMLQSGSINVQGCLTETAASAPLTGRWLLTQIGSETVSASERPPYLELLPEGSRVVGFAGCNRFGGFYELDGDNLRFRRLIATKVACAGPGADLEPAFLAALESVARYTLHGDDLALFNAAGDRLALFRSE